MAAAPMAPEQRTASARAAAPAATAKGRPSAVPAGRALSRAEMAGIMAMLAASAHHRAAGSANKISFGVKRGGYGAFGGGVGGRKVGSRWSLAAAGRVSNGRG